MNSDDEKKEDTTDFDNIIQDPKWKVNGVTISNLCFSLKNSTLNTDPSNLSDIRLLILNDIYKFEEDFSSSINKYCSSSIHKSINGPYHSICISLKKDSIATLNVGKSPPIGFSSSFDTFL